MDGESEERRKQTEESSGWYEKNLHQRFIDDELMSVSSIRGEGFWRGVSKQTGVQITGDTFFKTAYLLCHFVVAEICKKSFVS